MNFNRQPAHWRFSVGHLSIGAVLLGLGLVGSKLAWISAAEPLTHVSGKLPQDEGPSYNRDVRPILAEYCFACHGPDSAARKADLRLDQRDAAIEMGAIEPSDAESSELIARILSTDADSVMPPPESKKKLDDRQIEILKKWIADGAEYQSHWSFIAPQKTTPPVDESGWSKNPIDQFVLAEMKRHDLQPTEEENPRVFFRRLHLDITGLPPQPTDIEKFVADYPAGGEQALSKWIDYLMSQPSWGEHRGRYWLDAARYGDTHGMHFDNYREMWPYRDWVIRAFNRNQPWDQFVIEQLAGDLLPNPSTDQLVATGFQRCNCTTNEGGTIEEENLAFYAADRVQTTGWVFLGLTTNCCQCHDHKFDPLTMKDYYSMAAFFRNTTQSGLDGNSKDGRAAIVTLPTDEDLPRWSALPTEIETAKQQRDARKTAARHDFEGWLAGLSAVQLEASIPTESLIFHAKLNSGDALPLSATLPVETVLSTTGKLEWVADGKLGPAPKFSRDKTVVVGDIGDFEKSQPFSFGGWIKSSNNSTGGIIARMDEDAEYRGWDLWLDGNSYAVHFVDRWPQSAFKVRGPENLVKLDTWQHVFVTYDGSGKPEGVALFVDGQLQKLAVVTNQLAPDASIKTKTPTRIGQRSKEQIFQGGSAQDVRIFSRQLSEADVVALATNSFLSTMLALPAEQRSAEDTDRLFNHYLDRVDAQYVTLVENVTKLENELESIRKRSPITHVQQERMDRQPMANVLIRGEYDRKADEVTAGPPAMLPAFAADSPNNRLGLAQWLVSESHPLMTRVTVNRFWQELFGRGIVATPEDFGVMGMPPTHPELLDWLAVDFRENNWDVKRFYKLIFTSATYRQSSKTNPQKVDGDPQNTWLSHGPRFRMDAEMIRDCALAESGLLSSKMYGPSVKPYQPEGIWDVVGLPEGNTRNYQQDHGADLYRRSLYTFWKRMAPPATLESLNAPSREVCTVRRERTNTPLQALVTLNDPQFFEAARVLAEQALKNKTGDEAAKANWVAQRVLGRDLTGAEWTIVKADLAAYLTYYSEHVPDAKALISIGETKADSSLEVAPLAAWTIVCNQLMNLDEALNK